jgi:hypothetical protein
LGYLPRLRELALPKAMKGVSLKKVVLAAVVLGITYGAFIRWNNPGYAFYDPYGE